MNVDRQPEPERIPGQMEIPITGKYYGHDATPTERESGIAIEKADFGPLKTGGPSHEMLWEFRTGEVMTAYEASFRSTGNHHTIRREIKRLVDREFVLVEGVLPNPAPRGRGRVQAYRITESGQTELLRLGRPYVS